MAKKSKLGAPSPSPFDPFIVATGRDNLKPDENWRKRIRSQVMKGKNRTHKSRFRSAAPDSWINGQHGSDATRSTSSATPCEMQLDSPAIPPPVRVSDCFSTFFPFAIELQPYMKQLIYDFYTVFRKTMFPIGSCVDLNRDDQLWFQDLGHDPAYAHTVLYTAQVFFDSVRGQPLGARALKHMALAITELQHILAQRDPIITDSTIFTTLALCLLAEAQGDVKAAAQHLRGLHRLVEIRGGIEAFAEKPVLQMKCCRLDLAHALRVDAKPFFFCDANISWGSYLEDPRRPPATCPLHALSEISDIRLVNIWQDLHELARAANLAYQTGRKIPPRLFQEALISIRYRLQYLSYDSGNIQELLRIAMIACSSTIFLEAHGPPTHYIRLADQFRTMRSTFWCLIQDKSPNLALWLLFVGATSVLRTEAHLPQLQDEAAKLSTTLNLRSWQQVRSTLKDLIWVDAVHGDVGKHFYEGETTALALE